MYLRDRQTHRNKNQRERETWAPHVHPDDRAGTTFRCDDEGAPGFSLGCRYMLQQPEQNGIEQIDRYLGGCNL